MKQSPVLVNHLFKPLLDQLLNTLNDLSAEDWAKPTTCGDWSIRDVALHLLGDDIGILSWKRDGFSLSANITSWESLIEFINQSNQKWVEGLQRTSPRMLIDLLAFSGPQVCAFFDSLDPYATGGPVDWAGPEPAPVWLDLAREYTERWHHQQHIREAAGLPLLDQPEFLTPVLETFMFAFPHTYRDMDAAEGTVVTLTITGPAGKTWFIQRESGAWVLYQGKPENKASTAVSLDQDSAWRLFTNGLDPETARQRMQISGDTTLAQKALQILSILA